MSSKFLDFLHEHRSAGQVQAYLNRAPQADIDAVLRVGTDLLKAFPSVPGACAPMSALLAVGLEASVSPPIFVVAGELAIAGTSVFGRETSDWSKAFSMHNPSWDGHCWIMLGDRIIDISVCRTAYSGKGHPALQRHLLALYGRGRGLLAFRESEALEDGFDYAPRYILSPDEVDGLARGGLAIMDAL
jgi:hypothetical protein